MRELPDHWISLQEVIKQHSPVAKAFWGLACQEGLPCGDCWLSLSVTDQNFQLCYSSASHILLPRRHMEAQRSKARTRRPTSSASASLPVGRLPLPLLPQLSRVKTALLRPHLESFLALTSDSRSAFRALVYVQKLWHRGVRQTMFTRRWGSEPVWKRRSLLSGPSVGSSRERSEHGGEYKVPKTD